MLAQYIVRFNNNLVVFSRCTPYSPMVSHALQAKSTHHEPAVPTFSSPFTKFTSCSCSSTMVLSCASNSSFSPSARWRDSSLNTTAACRSCANDAQTFEFLCQQCCRSITPRNLHAVQCLQQFWHVLIHCSTLTKLTHSEGHSQHSVLQPLQVHRYRYIQVPGTYCNNGCNMYLQLPTYNSQLLQLDCLSSPLAVALFHLRLQQLHLLPQVLSCLPFIHQTPFRCLSPTHSSCQASLYSTNTIGIPPCFVLEQSAAQASCCIRWVVGLSLQLLTSSAANVGFEQYFANPRSSCSKTCNKSC